MSLLTNQEINIRDPYVLTHEGKYYLYGTRGPTCWGKADGFDCYVGENLENWEGPIEIFHNDGSFWSDENYWAPEVHCYKGAFYMFATFTAEGKCRGTQILKSKNPTGPFEIHSEGPLTPRDWECLDGTFYVDKAGKPYMVFCHEWQQVKDGTICYVPLSDDLRETSGKPVTMFPASEAPGVVGIRGGDNYVTDGPFLFRLEDDRLGMLWSSFGELGYVEVVSYSDNGDITGKWIHDEEFLFKEDGGHGMLFRDLKGSLKLTLHNPNTTLKERPVFYDLQEQKGTIVVV